MASAPTFVAAQTGSETRRPLARFAWGTLAYNVGVIVWGAYVRATGSGAGCGSHWPLCNGEVGIPTNSTKTLIEYTHRLTSGLALISVVVLLTWCWRATKKRDWSRYGAGFALAFMLNEAFLGAMLVKFNYVAENASAARAVVLSLHFANTLLLLASMAVTAYLLSHSSGALDVAPRRRDLFIVAVGLFAMLIVGVTGSLAALGDTLFPAQSLQSAWQQDFSSTSFFLMRLRLLHPIAALIGGAYVVWMLVRHFRLERGRRKLALAVCALLALQLTLGATNVLLLAPVPLQLIHLLVADLLWITLVLASTKLAIGPLPSRATS